MARDHSDLAATLDAEHRSHKNFWPFAAPNGIADVAGAYDVQRAFVAEMMKTRTGQPAGYKIGLTSKRMQEMCRIDSPIAGVVLPGGVHGSGTVLDRAKFGRLGVEFEIAVRLARDLPASAAPFDYDSVAAAVDAVAPAVEIVDDRNCDYKTLDVLSLVADNSWNEGLVHGPFVTEWPDLAGVTGTVFLDGTQMDQGMGRDVLGHPFIPLAWLANHLAAEGVGLRAGQIVMTGSIITTRFPTAPGRFRFEASGIGAVDVAIA